MRESGDVRASRAVLRQLAIGLSVHRLYPGDPHAGAFVAAVDRIRAAVDEALTFGAVRVDIRSGRFVVDDMLVHAEGIDRLAHACFERRVEHVGFDAVPTLEELATWFELLSTDAAELERGDGMAAALHTRGVQSIRATAGAPEPASGEEVPEHLLGLADWVDAVDEESNLADVELRLGDGEGGSALYDRLASLASSLPADGTVRTSFFQRAGWVVDDLPMEERAVFGRRLIDGLTMEDFAERFVGHLTDVAFAALLADVARQERLDPVVLGAQVGQAAGRHATLQQLLTTTFGDHHVDASAVDGQRTEAGFRPEDELLLAGFPATQGDDRRLAALALLDVLLNHPREDHLVRILENATEHLGQAVAAGDIAAADPLLEALNTVREVGPADLATRVGHPRSHAVTTDVVARATATAAASGGRLRPESFAPFGGAAIEPIVGALAQDLDAATAPWLIDVLVPLGTAHADVLRGVLGRQRPEVVARLVPVLARSGTPDAVSLLSTLSRRPEPAVQRAVVETLVRQDPAVAAPVIAVVAGRTTDKSLRNQCLDALAQFPHGVGRHHLEVLAAKGAGSVLPLMSRWRARRLARSLSRDGSAGEPS